jgi:two-component system response regulator FixJ
VEALSPRTIFILDDDEVVRDSLKVLLETRNFTVVDFTSGADLLKRGDKADCLILDLHMPEMTGAELLSKLRGRGDHTPAILITGRPDKSAQGAAEQLNVPLFEKPVSPKLLLAAIDKALGSRRY